MKRTTLAVALALALPGAAHAQKITGLGYSSFGIAQFPKSGPGCNAFWVEGPNGRPFVAGRGTTTNPVGQWYAVAATDGGTPNEQFDINGHELPAPVSDPNRAGRWMNLMALYTTGQQIWPTSPSEVGIPVSEMPEYIACSVPGLGPQLVPNALIYVEPDQPK